MWCHHIGWHGIFSDHLGGATIATDESVESPKPRICHKTQEEIFKPRTSCISCSKISSLCKSTNNISKPEVNESPQFNVSSSERKTTAYGSSNTSSTGEGWETISEPFSNYSMISSEVSDSDNTGWTAWVRLQKRKRPREQTHHCRTQIKNGKLP